MEGQVIAIFKSTMDEYGTILHPKAYEKLKECEAILKDIFTHHDADESLEEAVQHQMEDDSNVDDFVR